MVALKRSLWSRALAAFLLAALTLTLTSILIACDAESDEVPPEETKGDVMVSLWFDEVSYVDAAMTAQNLIDRVRHQTRSAFLALRKSGVSVAWRRQVDVDLAELRREPVTVVDPETGITRSALRLRYHFEALAIVPSAVLQKGELAVGVLHTLDDSKLRDMRPLCAPAADAKAPLWSVFDVSLPACAAAMTAEAEAIEAARTRLTDPAREIVSSEFERRYLPLRVHVEVKRKRARWTDADAGAGALVFFDDDAGLAEPDFPPGVKMPEGIYWPGEPGEEGVPAQGVAGSVDDAQREKHLEQAEAEDDEDEELHKVRRPAYNNGIEQQRYYAPAQRPRPPNFTLLYVAAVVGLAILIVSWRRREGRK